MEKILISACLLGERVRYDGGGAACRHPALRAWAAEGRLVPVCPEVAGGLSVPRPPAEIVGAGAGRAVAAGAVQVRTIRGDDVSDAFLAGAEAAVATARRHRARLAILKDGSPSCARTFVYDGSFSGTRVAGMGVTAAMLEAEGVKVFADTEVDAAAAWLARIER